MSRRKIYVSLNERQLAAIERERIAAEAREGTRVDRDDVIEALLSIGLELAGEPAE